MKSRVLYLFLLSSTNLETLPSLFFTKEEVLLIKENRGQKEEGGSRFIYLSAMVYVDATHWTLWINDKIIHAEETYVLDDVHIEAVTPQKVTFSYIPSIPQRRRTFILCPHQTYLLDEKRVIEGIKGENEDGQLNRCHSTNS